MKDNFDIHEYKNQLRSKLIEEELTGFDAFKKVVQFMRERIYPKLSEKEMDAFVVEIVRHFDAEPPSYRLSEKEVTLDDSTEFKVDLKHLLDKHIISEEQGKIVIKLKDLTFDILKTTFSNLDITPGIGGIQFPTRTDAMRMVGDEQDLESWKEETEEMFGNVKLRLDPAASAPFDRVEVMDIDFNKAKQDYEDAKAAALKSYASKD